jgi:dTDP-glucose 4,6-dehydratase
VVVFVDIDETICSTPEGVSRDYSLAIPIQENIDKINSMYDSGDTIIYWTARGSRTGINWLSLTKSQLATWGCKHHGVRCDKPYFDKLIDDRTIRIEEC